MKKVIIYRKYKSLGVLAKFKIYFNSDFQGYISNGEEIEINHNESKIELLIKHLFWKKKITIDNTKDVERIETSFNINERLFWVFGILLFLFFVLYFFTKNIYIHYFSLFILFVFIYYIAFKKDRIYINRL